VVCRIPLMVGPVNYDSDMVRYVWDGRVQRFGYNPYAVVPSEPAVAHTHTADTVRMPSRHARTPYPPAAQLFFRLMATVWESARLMKSVLTLLDICTIFIVLRWLRAIGQPTLENDYFHYYGVVVDVSEQHSEMEKLARTNEELGAFLHARVRDAVETQDRLLREVTERMPELILLLIGAWHDQESGADADFRALRGAANVVWLGRRSDEEAARLILLADVGIVPFERSEFNDTALPYRIVKYAKLGRRTIAPDLKGVRTWDRAVTVASGVDEWIAALRSQAGVRTRPDTELREWALAQTAHEQNRPLWERMEALGIETGRLGSERLSSG